MIDLQIAAIKKQILEDCPKLKDDSLNDLERTNLLRDWAYANTNSLSDNFSEKMDYSKSLRENFISLTKGFQNFEVSALCGGLSAYLVFVYDAFGYQAISLDSQAPNGGLASHVVTLVQIQDEGEEKWIIQDPLFNRVYVGADGSPLDIHKLMTLLKEKRDDEICYSFGDTQARYVVFNSPPDIKELADPALIAPNTLEDYAYLKGEVKEVNSRYGVLCDMRQPLAFQVSIQRILEDTLGPEGYPPKADYLYLFPVGVNMGNVPDRAAMLAELQAFAVK